MADDLVDEALSQAAALEWIDKLTKYLDFAYATEEKKATASLASLNNFIAMNFPKPAHTALKLFPIENLPKEPLYELLEGFRMDLLFTQSTDNQQNGGGNIFVHFPIADERLLELYAHRVASTVGELCLRLVMHHYHRSHEQFPIPEAKKAELVDAAHTMGHALQYVNIARDVQVDAAMGRVYLPTTWLQDEGLTPADIVVDPGCPAADRLRQRLLDLAFAEYARSRPVMHALPDDVRGPLVVAVESYMEIGRVLREKEHAGFSPVRDPRRATVPLPRRLWVAWKNLSA